MPQIGVHPNGVWPATLPFGPRDPRPSNVQARGVRGEMFDDEPLPFDLDDERWDALIPEDEPYERLPEDGDLWIETENSASSRRGRPGSTDLPPAA